MSIIAVRLHLEEMWREQDARELAHIMTCPRKLKRRLLRERAAKRRGSQRQEHKRFGNRGNPFRERSGRGWSFTSWMRFYHQKRFGIGDGRRAENHREGLGMGKRGVNHAKKWLLALVEDEMKQ